MRDTPVAKELYLHYCKGLYVVLAVATNHDTGVTDVVYHHPNTPEEVWTRPVEAFMASIEVNGVKIDRFTRVETRLN